MKISILLSLLVFAIGCHSKPTGPLTFSQRLAEAHNTRDWKDKAALAGDLHVEVINEGQEQSTSLDFHFTYEIATGKVRMQLADNTILVYDGQSAWVSPASAKTARARYTLLHWPALMLLPFRLNDPGVKVWPEEQRELGSEKCPSVRVAFETGDLAQNAYLIYLDPKGSRVRGIAYVDAMGRSTEEAEDNAHAVTFYRYELVDGMAFPADWRLWNWKKKTGLAGMPVGTARLYNLEFIVPKKNAFVRPPDARVGLSRIWTPNGIPPAEMSSASISVS